MGECQDDCGDCTTADPVVVYGSDAVTSNSSIQYTASGGIGPYTWAVSGTGATIDETGLVTLDETACGGITVTATDTCGLFDTQDVRVTDSGHWVASGDCLLSWEHCPVWGSCELIRGFTKRHELQPLLPGCSPICCLCGAPTLTECTSGTPVYGGKVHWWYEHTWECL
jgi:hypothetical protein